MSSARRVPMTILLPDLISHWMPNPHKDRNHELVSIESKRWMFNGDPDLDEHARRAFNGLKAGKFASMCYANAGYPQLRVCSDFLNWFFHLDNLSDDMDDRGIDNIANVVMNSIYHPYTYHCPARLNRMTKDFYKRFIQTASPGTCRRLQETLELFFKAIQQQAFDRTNDTIPDFESYISLRRDTSGCKTTWVLIEYAYNLNLPDDVLDHSIIRSLGEAANDFVAWSNVGSLWVCCIPKADTMFLVTPTIQDIFSYDDEQSRGHTHNMIDVIMHEQGLGLQDAVNVVGDYCKCAIDRFVHDRANLPSWGPVIDADVRAYVDGLENWISGVLHWSFETERYFGKAAKQVKATRLVTLRPKIVKAPVRET